MSGLDYFGAESQGQTSNGSELGASLVWIGAGIAGAAFWRNHPVLGFLTASIVANNTRSMIQGEQSWQDGIKGIATNGVGVISSLNVPSHPAVAYIFGNLASDVLIGLGKPSNLKKVYEQIELEASAKQLSPPLISKAR